MKFQTISVIFLLLVFNFSWSQKQTIDSIKTQNGFVKIQPILHSSFIITYNNKTIFIYVI